MYKQEIREQCEALSNEELHIVINNKRRYNFEIVSAAQQELRRRNVSKEELKELSRRQMRRELMIEGDIYEDLTTLDKVGFYFFACLFLVFWPLRMVLRIYTKKGYHLKMRQGVYYLVSGICFFLLGVALYKFDSNWALPAFLIWLLGFLTVYLFNEKYVRRKTIEELEKRKVD